MSEHSEAHTDIAVTYHGGDDLDDLLFRDQNSGQLTDRVGPDELCNERYTKTDVDVTNVDGLAC